jgi:hypothetical protein
MREFDSENEDNSVESYAKFVKLKSLNTETLIKLIMNWIYFTKKNLDALERNQ